MTELELISIGKLTKTHALKGAIKMRPFNIDTDFFKYTKIIFLENKKEFKIEKIQKQNDGLILTLDGIKSIDDAKELQGLEVFIEKSKIPVDEDEILLADMIDFNVMVNNKLFGKIFDFADYSAGLIYIVKDNNDDKYYFPDRDEFIEKIDYEEKIIYFKDIDEFLD
jgi:16S rRNA processing protein RimM